jgi:hypothetical protein
MHVRVAALRHGRCLLVVRARSTLSLAGRFCRALHAVPGACGHRYGQRRGQSAQTAPALRSAQGRAGDPVPEQSPRTRRRGAQQARGPSRHGRRWRTAKAVTCDTAGYGPVGTDKRRRAATVVAAYALGLRRVPSRRGTARAPEWPLSASTQGCSRSAGAHVSQAARQRGPC